MDITLDPAKDNYCVMGNPIAHSLSPKIHSQFALECEQAVFYQALLVDEHAFNQTADFFFTAGGKGCNVTLPFKGQALAFADVATEQSQHTGAVNVLWQDANGKIHADSTDGTGLAYDLKNKQINLSNKNVLIAGAGSVVNSVMMNLLGMKPQAITLANRTVSRAQAIVERFPADPVRLSCCGYTDLTGKHFDVVLNASSSALSGAGVSLPAGILSDEAECYDMVYGAAARPFIQWAQENGAKKIADGLGMLVEQAAESFHIWRGIRPNTQSVMQTLHSEVNGG